MENLREVSVASDHDESQLLGKILCQCFGFPQTEWEDYGSSIGLDNFRLIRHNKKVAGGLAIYRMGQWFGDRCIPMAGLAAVGIAPEYRGQGMALELLRETLKELHAEKVAISTLYPAVQSLYRGVGYEYGGTRCLWELPLSTLKSRPSQLKLERMKRLEIEALIDVYNQQVNHMNGYLDRHPAFWKNIIKAAEGEEVYGYWIGSSSLPQGYVIFQQKGVLGSLSLEIRDWVTLSADATNCLFSFLASHRSQVDQCRWYGGAVEPKLMLLAEQNAKLVNYEQWMLRIVDLVTALESRAYSVNLETELHLSVIDDLLEENQGNFVLEVAAGNAQVKRGGRGEFHLKIGSLAPLYAGLLGPRQLQKMGWLECTDSALRIAEYLFPMTTSPAMPDFF
ncbi:enhanced intracellular survival protein Eis [Lyngbya sp. PCC 8106]|uniref:GNAT family N-acetyltransferase n=1 Tax=Lyngbya sp. (strain PCC 8106) TaxID=313612 RepID=UPI0000EAAA24|nr:GNAT family N-acetyltransferase [Lyngbya sp. PCC 8106]EAW37437.1 GCN5-related N-acetyltransferase [Lyngbya sp. PCC 8106]